MQPGTLALQTFENRLRRNRYPGLGLVIGRLGADEWVMDYWIMGRILSLALFFGVQIDIPNWSRL